MIVSHDDSMCSILQLNICFVWQTDMREDQMHLIQADHFGANVVLLTLGSGRTFDVMFYPVRGGRCGHRQAALWLDYKNRSYRSNSIRLPWVTHCLNRCLMILTFQLRMLKKLCLSCEVYGRQMIQHSLVPLHNNENYILLISV